MVYADKEQANKAVAEMHGKEFWGMNLNVEIASDRAANKPKTKSTLENREATPGPAETSEGTATQPASFTERSIAILNLPDTVSDVRLKPLVEKYGFKKIKLEPQHGGALIEFHTAEEAGKAGFALENLEFEGRKLRIGTVQDLNKQKGEWKASSSFIQPTRVNRPAGQGGRGRGRPGFGRGRPVIPRAADAPKSEAKSNADFRSMFLKAPAKEPEHKKDNDDDKMEE